MEYQKSTFISPLAFLVAIIAFFFTFTEIDCNGQQLDTISGIELVTGYEQDFDILGSETNTDTKKERYDPNIFALNAMLAAVLGLLLHAFKKMRANYQLLGLLGAVGLICLIAMMIDLKTKLVSAQNDSGGKLNIDLNISIKMKFGYWLAVISFAAATAWNFMQLSQRKKNKLTAEEMAIPDGDDT